MALTVNSHHNSLYDPDLDHDGDDEDPNGFPNLSTLVGRRHYSESMKISDSEDDRAGTADSNDEVLCDQSETFGSDSEDASLGSDQPLSYKAHRRATQDNNVARPLKRDQTRFKRGRAQQQRRFDTGRQRHQHKLCDDTGTTNEAERAARKAWRKAKKTAIMAGTELKAAAKDLKKARTGMRKLRRLRFTSCLLLLTLLVSDL